jgi:hypothetical protein
VQETSNTNREFYVNPGTYTNLEGIHVKFSGKYLIPIYTVYYEPENVSGDSEVVFQETNGSKKVKTVMGNISVTDGGEHVYEFTEYLDLLSKQAAEHVNYTPAPGRRNVRDGDYARFRR